MSNPLHEIHITDVKTFKSCRRRWDWSSHHRRNLEPLFTPIHFVVGKAVHFALATYYETGELPLDVFTVYMDKYIGGLKDVWPEEMAKLVESVNTCKGMLENYVYWVRSTEQPDARWEVVATEQPLDDVELPGLEGSGLYYTGVLDQIIRDRETGELWIREFKTAGRDPNADWLELDDQNSMYAWAAQKMLGRQVVGIQYRFLLKRFPTKPPRLKNGSLSKAINSPQTMVTSYAHYVEAINELAGERAGLMPGAPELKAFVKAIEDPDGADIEMFKNDPAWKAGLELSSALEADYADVLVELARRGFASFFKEFEVRKTPIELDNAARDVAMTVKEMMTPNVPIYTSADWLKCQFCPFRTPCKSANAGGSFELILQHEFKPRVREDRVARVVEDLSNAN